MIVNNVNEIINKFFSSPLTKYQIGLETSMKVSDFAFDSIDGMHYKCTKVILNQQTMYRFF